MSLLQNNPFGRYTGIYTVYKKLCPSLLSTSQRYTITYQYISFPTT